MKETKIIVFSAPSGSGKTTLINFVRSKIENLHFSVSATSRQPRGEERNGVEYFFLSPEEFRQKISENAFIEYEEVYPDKFYGTLKSQVEKQLEQGENVLLDIDVKGAVNVKKIYGKRALLIFVRPPSIETLKERLIRRGTDTPEMIQKRVDKAAFELTFATQFDCVITNDDLLTAQKEALHSVEQFLET